MRPAVVILSHTVDAGAALVATELVRELGPERVIVLRPETLAAARWSHWVSARGKTETRLEWSSGACVTSGVVGALLNRSQYLPLPQFRHAVPKDREYAQAELHAVVAGWLGGLGDRVVPSVMRHPTMSQGITRVHWVHAAARAGLPVSLEEHEADSTESVLVAGNEVGGPLVMEFGPGCRCAASDLGYPLIEFVFTRSNSKAELVGVSPLPPLLEPWAVKMTARLLTSISNRCSQ